jgi:hypothetical protein
MPITVVNPGDLVYLSLRFFSTKVYDEVLLLPDKFHVNYVVRLEYTHFNTKAHKRIQGTVPVFKTRVEFDHIRVLRWGQSRVLSPDMMLVDEQYIRANKDILQLVLEKTTRAKLEKYYT